MSASPVPEGEYAGLPGAGSWLVQIDDDRGPADDGVVPVDCLGLGVNTLEDDRADESSVLGGYPELADLEAAKPDESADGADPEGESAEGDDGVVHIESRALDSLAV